MNDSTIAALIEMIRGDLSRNQLSNKAGVEPMSITRWTNGTRISLVDFAKLCKAQDKTLTDVFEFLEERQLSLKDIFDVPEEYALQVHNLIIEVLKFEKLNLSSEKGRNLNIAADVIRNISKLLQDEEDV
jgi:hypothetical protein